MRGEERTERGSTESLVVYVVTYPEKNYVEWVRSLVERKLVACVNVIPIRSLYRWEGSIVDEGEVLLLMKTSTSKSRALREVISREHPYEIPEIVEISPLSVNEKYLNWVVDATS
ncbi:MAG: divalent-cation tolerance protein CutA [Aigarchaeota archaeon]|nr:divalent-cation tolerance protein CutA [Aigarchaeota archaeon]MDW8093138.1 divalent-cation tolerance protein CutA [Nitrososphaerota archaeon]